MDTLNLNHGLTFKLIILYKMQNTIYLILQRNKIYFIKHNSLFTFLRYCTKCKICIKYYKIYK